MKKLIDKLHRDSTLSPDEFRRLITAYTPDDVAYINRLGQELAEAKFGRKIYIRGLIEIGNCCKNDCFYCGIRKSNSDIERFRLDKSTILACADEGYSLGFRTFVLQGGEDNYMNDNRVVELVAEIRNRYPDAAITLSLGERPTESYQRFYDAGANRYLLRHETHNPDHYAMLHPKEMSLSNRIRCLNDLKRIGFQTGSGIMVGTPGQTVEHIVEDILFLEQLQPQMIGMGPFLPHHQTPFAHHPAGNLELTLLLLSVFRLMHPNALIPSTTALASLAHDGRERGILAGANVVMPNLSPVQERRKYALYDNKASMGAEAAEGLKLLAERLERINYSIDFGRGDF